MPAPEGAAWAVMAEHPALGNYHLYGRQQADLLYTENESNNSRLWGTPNAGPYVKDAFHRYVVDGELTAVNPAQQGTKFGAVHKLTIAPGKTETIDLVLSAAARPQPFVCQDRFFPSVVQKPTLFSRPCYRKLPIRINASCGRH